MNSTQLTLCAALTTLSAITTASAAPVYSFYFLEPSYSLAPGDTANVPVYVEEFTPAGDTARFAPGNGVTFASVLISASDADVTFSSFTRAAGWETHLASTVSPTVREISVLSPIATPVTAALDLIDLNTRRILLGNITIQGGLTLGSTDFVASYSDLGISTKDETLITAVSSASFTATVVPEPTLLAPLILLGTTLLRRKPA